MVYTPLGVIADTLWHEINQHTKNVELGEFVVMPNHIHGILIIHHVETLHATFPDNTGNFPNNIKNNQMANFSPKSGTISAIIRSYKSAVSRHASRSGLTFEWQARFHDHIIRDATSHTRIATYIAENPQNWETDKFYGQAPISPRVETLHATSPTQ